MSREVSVRLRCDRCGLTAEEGGSVQEALQFGGLGSSYEIDLCGTCEAALFALLGDWGECGRSAASAARARRGARSGAGSRKRSGAGPKLTSSSSAYQCPECLRTYSARQSLAGHARNSHQATLTELVKKAEGTTPDGRLACPGCDRSFRTMAGRTRHLRQTHGRSQE